MLSATISKMILNALTKGQSGNNPSITANAYLALLTTMPNDQGVGAVEVDKTVMLGYSRLQIGEAGASKTSLDNKPFFPIAGAAWSSDDNAYKIENTANMQMSAIEDGIGETVKARVYGFAICKSATNPLYPTGSQDPATATDMLAWGELIDADTQEPTYVDLEHGSVPVFYYDSTANSGSGKGDFTLLLGAADAAEE